MHGRGAVVVAIAMAAMPAVRKVRMAVFRVIVVVVMMVVRLVEVVTVAAMIEIGVPKAAVAVVHSAMTAVAAHSATETASESLGDGGTGHRPEGEHPDHRSPDKPLHGKFLLKTHVEGSWVE
jgi:hypothetical protein